MMMKEFNIRKPKNADEIHVSDLFLEIVKKTNRNSRICIAFDEIEYISPLAHEDQHWKKEFVPFWQTLWSVQSEVRRISVIIAGINPTIVEKDTFDSDQNPIFGIVKPAHIKGLEHDSLRTMVETLGVRMGLRFTESSISYLYNRYGGHPLLTRKVCSYVDSKLERANRPITIDPSILQQEEDERDADLTFYCRHVVSALQLHYPDEYEMLEMLATNQEVDFYELAREKSWTKHLSDYGLVNLPANGRPSFAIPVIGRYIRMEKMRVTGSMVGVNLLPTHKRVDWLRRRKISIIQNIRTLYEVSKSHDIPELYKAGNIAETEKFMELVVVQNGSDIDNFMNVMYRSFIEPIRSKKKEKKYFENVVQEFFPDYWVSLDRVRIYRHKFAHLELIPDAQRRFDYYMDMDFGSTEYGDVPEYWFAFQQLILEEILLTLIIEIDRKL